MNEGTGPYIKKSVANSERAAKEKLYKQLYDKYEPVTEVLFDFKRRWRTSIHHISYQ